MVTISIGIVSLLGTRLITLSREKGRTNRIATIAQSAHGNHFGAFLKIARRTITVRISQLADKLRFNTLIRIEFMINSPS